MIGKITVSLDENATNGGDGDLVGLGLSDEQLNDYEEMDNDIMVSIGISPEEPTFKVLLPGKEFHHRHELQTQVYLLYHKAFSMPVHLKVLCRLNMHAGHILLHLKKM